MTSGYPPCHLKLGKDEPQPEVVVAVVGVVVVPIGNTAVPGVVVPAAATVHAVRAYGCSLIQLFNNYPISFMRSFLLAACCVKAISGIAWRANSS